MAMAKATSAMKTRAQMLDHARSLRAEIDQIFTDAAVWNDFSDARRVGYAPINPDPDGQLRRIADGIDRILANDAGRMPLVEIKED